MRELEKVAAELLQRVTHNVLFMQMFAVVGLNWHLEINEEETSTL